MRDLWRIERAVLEAAAHDYPHSAECLKRQMESAQVVNFENTGAGFFSTLAVTPEAPRLSDKSPLDAAAGRVTGVKLGMGFVVFLDDGHVSLIEGYSFGDDNTVNIDFDHVDFELKPWSEAGQIVPG